MIASIKAELRKLLTVRSTYFISIIALIIVILVAGWGNGFRADTSSLRSSSFLASQATNAVLFDGILIAIIGLLLLGHEYRYNTILYTLTSSKSRVKSLLAKVIVVSIFALIASAIIAF